LPIGACQFLPSVVGAFHPWLLDYHISFPTVNFLGDPHCTIPDHLTYPTREPISHRPPERLPQICQVVIKPNENT
ncbi:MAG: hypothetical protein AB4426_25515, partial [Xenococcaceae cyanobacterium]